MTIFSSVLVFVFIFHFSISPNPPTICDYELILAQNSYKDYYGNSYFPPKVENLEKTTRSIRASMDAILLICFNETTIIDPTSPNNSQCLLSLDKLAVTAQEYSVKDPSSILNNVKPTLRNQIYQTRNDCRDVFISPSSKKDKYPDECFGEIDNLKETIDKYLEERFLGDKDGKEYLIKITLALEKQRKYCDISEIAKQETSKKDTCKSSNDWFASLAETMLRYINKKSYNDYMYFFKLWHQSSYRAYQLCKDSK